VFATFESGIGYFGSRAQQTMLNFRVRDLDAMLAQLRANGADVANETQDMEGVGRFGWVTDPEGNRVELWQPASPRLQAGGDVQVADWLGCRGVNLKGGAATSYSRQNALRRPQPTAGVPVRRQNLEASPWAADKPGSARTAPVTSMSCTGSAC
jgi:hypothetical protein